MLNEEPAQSQDLQMMGMLLPLGIEKGKDFKPDVATVARLNSASGSACLVARTDTHVRRGRAKKNAWTQWPSLLSASAMFGAGRSGTDRNHSQSNHST